MTDTLNTLTSDELCEILKVDLRSILSTKGFPKPTFDGRKYFFERDKVLKFFNIENFDEGFISLKDAADYLDITQARLMSLSKNHEVPNYRLKSAKGSGYLFRKSELDIIKDIQIESDIHFINLFIGDKIIRDLFRAFCERHFKNISTAREYEVIVKYFFDKVTFEQMSEEYELTRERVRQIFERGCRRMRFLVENLTPEELYRREKEIIRLNAEVSYLKKLITTEKPELKSDVDRAKDVKMLSEMIVTFGNKKLRYEDELSVRALNCLHGAEIFTVYDLMKNFRLEDNSIYELKKFRNFGVKTLKELIEYIKEKNKQFEELTGFSPNTFFYTSVFRKKPDPNQVFISLVNEAVEKCLKIEKPNDNKEN